MTQYAVVWDTDKERLVALTSSTAFNDSHAVAAASQTNFDTNTNINSTDVIDVWVDGRLKREGASHDYQRNTGTNQIVFNTGLNAGSWVKSRVHSTTIPSFTDEEFDASASQTEFVIAGGIDASQTVDVEVDGRLKREGASYDYQRNATQNKIVFNSGLSAGSWVRVRVFAD
jgi:hypothetical protein